MNTSIHIGGAVVEDGFGNHRVGGLAMSRSIGDVKLKGQGVTHVPDVCCIKIEKRQDSFIMLGTDGVFEFLSNTDACHVVNSSGDVEDGVTELVSLAIQLSATGDNTSAIVIKLDAWGKFMGSSDKRNIHQMYGKGFSRFRPLSLL